MAGSLGCPPNLSVIKAFSFTLGSFRRVKFRKYKCGYGGIGRRARFRF
jgi:hypothetical protein